MAISEEAYCPTPPDEEFRVLQERADRLFKDGCSGHRATDGVFCAALENRAEFKSPNATQSSIYDVDRVFDNRTSLLIDPPDGKVPALTGGAQASGYDGSRPTAPR